jgi:transcriptional regulator with XRE-family HTH domain
MGDVINPQLLRALREARGWDQQTLELTAEVDPSVVSRLERGLQVDLKASVPVALARALDTPVDTLLVAPRGHDSSALVLELSAILGEVAKLSPAQQRQVAAIMRAYVSALPE